MNLSDLATTGNDTICAISTPHGSGGIAVARISGPQALDILAKIWKGKNPCRFASHTAHLGTVTDPRGADLDQAVATVFRAPNSYTGQDVAEISVHGSTYIQRELIQSLLQAGARMANPGEFTALAYLNGRLPLTQAEAVGDIIAADSRASHSLAMAQMKDGYARRLEEIRSQFLELASLLELELDFSEEDLEFADRQTLRRLAAEIICQTSAMEKSFTTGNAIKEGIPVAITGAANAGKSSILNAILGDNRAIVSNIPGTTRDTVEETIEIGDYKFRFIDTAGFRATDDPVEKLGISRSVAAIEKALINIAIIDPRNPTGTDISQASAPLQRQDNPGTLIIVINKTDTLDTIPPELEEYILRHTRTLPAQNVSTLKVSAKTGEGIQQLKETIALHGATLQNGAGAGGANPIVTNARHAQALRDTNTEATQMLQALDQNLSAELVVQHLRKAIAHLSSITAPITTDDLLSNIFSNFCVGK